VIQRELQNPLATMILEGRVTDGQTVSVGAEGGVLTIDGVAVSAAPTPVKPEGVKTVH
jgi:ATP-dependent Clp protease ATP-binding subunit ClpB